MSLFDAIRKADAESARHREVERQAQLNAQERDRETRARTAAEQQAAERERMNRLLHPKG